MEHNASLQSQAQLGAHLRALRQAADLTQQDIADAFADTTATRWLPSTVAKVEAGQRALAFDEAAAYARVLRISLDDLLTDDSAALLAYNSASRDLSAAIEAAEDALARINAVRGRLKVETLSTPTEDALARLVALAREETNR